MARVFCLRATCFVTPWMVRLRLALENSYFGRKTFAHLVFFGSHFLKTGHFVVESSVIVVIRVEFQSVSVRASQICDDVGKTKSSIQSQTRGDLQRGVLCLPGTYAEYRFIHCCEEKS